MHLFDQQLRKNQSPPPHPLRPPNSERPKIASDSDLREHRVEIGGRAPLMRDLRRGGSEMERMRPIEPTSRMSHRTEVVRRRPEVGQGEGLVLPKIKDRFSNSMNRLGRISGKDIGVGAGKGVGVGRKMGYMVGRKMDENAMEHY